MSVVVFRNIYRTSRWEVRIELELLSMQVFDGRIADVVEVVGQNLRRESNGNSFGSLCQKQGEFGGKCDRLLVAAVVGKLPFGSLGVENHVEGELRKPCLNVSGRCGTVARKDISPVSLRVDKQVFLSHLYEGVTDGSVAVRVELHCMAHDIGHLVIAPVVHTLHGVQDTALNGLQTVFDMGNGTLQDYVGSVIQEPILIHAAEMVYDSGIKSVHGFIVGMGFAPCSGIR